MSHLTLEGAGRMSSPGRYQRGLIFNQMAKGVGGDYGRKEKREDEAG